MGDLREELAPAPVYVAANKDHWRPARKKLNHPTVEIEAEAMAEDKRGDSPHQTGSSAPVPGEVGPLNIWRPIHLISA